MPNAHFTKQYNKIIIAGDVLMDLSSDTVAAGSMLSGVTAHDKNGASITGSIPTKTSSNVTIETTGTNAGKVTVASGYYASQVQKAMTNASISLSDPSITAAPAITWDSTNKKIKGVTSGSGSVSATVSTPGFVSSISDTGSVTVSGTTSVTAESLMNTLVAANIKTGVTIFNTTGTFTADGTASAGEILDGETAYVNGTKITGSMTKYDDDTQDHVTITSTTDVAIPAGYYDGSVKAGIDATSKTELVGSNILTGHTILGVEGTLEPSSSVTHGAVTATPKFTSQTILPSSISKQFIDSVTVNAISYTEATTGTTSGYTLTITNSWS